MGPTYSYTSEFDKAKKQPLQFSKQLTKESVYESIRQMALDKIPTMDDFKWACVEATKHFTQQQNHVQIKVRPKDRLILVGDMHGCFETMMRMFLGEPKLNIDALGFPGLVDSNDTNSVRNVYLFNGDLVDRGGSGYQIIFALCLLVLIEPGCVYVNRGNHESDMFGCSTQPGMGYKFLFEIQEKFPELDFSVYKQQIADLFYAFPICHTIDENIFVVHGGVPMSNDPNFIAQTPYMQQATVQKPNNCQPYDLKDLKSINPSRQQTALLEDQPKSKETLWHQFLWSYDRQPYAADFMKFNNLKTIVCSHTATPYHFITTFLPIEPNSSVYNVQSVARGDDTFEKVRNFFNDHPNLQQIKLSIVEIFSSPTNQGGMYACVIPAIGEKDGDMVNYDPLHWDYAYLGCQQDFKFVQETNSNSY